MANTPAGATALAKSQIGYREGYANGSWDNIEKYAGLTPGLHWANGYAWCATFVSWVLYSVGALGKLTVTASVASFRDQGKNLGRFSEYPTVGAIVIYGTSGSAHTGLVVGYDSSYIYTVEGNTNDNGSAEGNGVYYKKRLRSSSYVYGYVLPYYDAFANSADPAWNGKWMGSGVASTTTKVVSKVVKSASKSTTTVNKKNQLAISLAHVVKAAEADPKRTSGGTTGCHDDVLAVEGLLWRAMRYGKLVSLPGQYAKDGIYGEVTVKAYAQWQKHLGYSGTDANGIPGSASLTKLIAAYGRGQYVLVP